MSDRIDKSALITLVTDRVGRDREMVEEIVECCQAAHPQYHTGSTRRH